MRRFNNFWVATAALCLARASCGEPIFPTTIGASWEYSVEDSSARGQAPGIVRVVIAGQEQLQGKDFLKLETRTDDVLQKTQLIAVDADGITCARRVAGGKTTDFNPPQKLLPAPLKFNARWEMDDDIAGREVHQQFTVKLESDVTVPGGTFHTFLCEAEEPWPISIAVQRWFSPGTGLIKEITTTRGPGGRLLNRKTMALRKFSPAPATPIAASNAPNETAPPSPSPTPGPVKVILIPARERDGELATDFRSNAPNIFVRWTGQNLPVGGHVRVAWVVEDVGEIAEPNFIIDETTVAVTAPELGAQFTLARPKDGWAAGKYRVELYLNDQLLDTANVTIRD